ncbi:MAG: DMT family transporter [Ruminococcaceae bacterium]|nr:DMT family transporter [Oscillospiraceae bacterium]
MNTTKNRFLGPLLLLLTAFIWGTSFVAQSKGMERIEAFTFNGIRTVLGALSLLPVIAFQYAGQKRREGEKAKKPFALSDKTLWIGGLCCGLALCVASNFQQQAFNDPGTSSGKIAFLTAMYMIIVPLMGLFLRKKIPLPVWISVFLGVFGVYLLCINEGFTLSYGDILALCCALFYSIHILLIDHFSPQVDGVQLSCLQFFVSGTLSLICMGIFETPILTDILAVAPAILYSGVLSCGVAYTLQVVGQKGTDPTVASLIMCLESVFGVLSGWAILGETLSAREIAGCVIMFAAILLTQVKWPLKEAK